MKYQRSFIAALLFGLLFVSTRPTVAQSSDQSLPTPVLSNEIDGRIAALDLGDPRVTRRFYAFEGTPGDLLITLNTRNLNGDIDVFTAVTFRPLMKTTMYANTLSQEITKGLYLRTRQILILRVEARTPNDDEGSYHIRFGGSFSPFSGGIPVAENTPTQSDASPSSGGNKRLSSSGATIAKPVTETPATVEPKPASENAAEKSAGETETKKTGTAKATTAKPARTTTARRTGGRGSRPASSKPPPDKKPADDTTTKTGSEATKKENPGEEKSAVTSEKPATAEKPATQETVAPQPGARLIIEEKDGTKIERPMSTVRRVVVEGNMIVIVLKTGRIERVPMSIVARMAIEP